MKTLFSSIALSLLVATASAFDHSAYDAVLKRYVNSKGMVDYTGLKENRSSLDAYLQKTGAVSEAQFDSWSEDEQIAFLTNVYNAETLQYIIDNYPLESIKDLGGLLSSAWDKKNVILFGEKTTLNKVEHDILRVDYDEPRIHFALVCAAMSCPPLRREAYTGAKLDSQLDDQARTFLAESNKNRVEGDTVYLSSIFDWYGKDFAKGDDALKAALNPWFKADISDKEIEYTDYDWSLNDQK